MFNYCIVIELFNGECHTYQADNFIVVDGKLEVIIEKSVISYDFDLIDSVRIDNQEED